MRRSSVTTRTSFGRLLPALLLSISAGCEGPKVFGPSSVVPADLVAFIFVADSSGAVLGRLTEGGWPSWSPDGRRIVFERDGRVRIIDADGTNERDLGKGLWPTWSPDGNRIAFASAEGISVMNADGSSARALLSPTLFAVHGWGVGKPSWSPDGALIAFDEPGAYLDGGTARIFVMKADGTSQYEPGGFGSFESEPSWSPDGTRLVYWSDDGGLVTVPRGGGLPVRHLSFDEAASFFARPAWSPNGRSILFNGRSPDGELLLINERKQGPLMTISAEGGRARVLIDRGADAAWSPDGTRIAFMRREAR